MGWQIDDDGNIFLNGEWVATIYEDETQRRDDGHRHFYAQGHEVRAGNRWDGKILVNHNVGFQSPARIHPKKYAEVKAP